MFSADQWLGLHRVAHWNNKKKKFIHLKIAWWGEQGYRGKAFFFKSNTNSPRCCRHKKQTLFMFFYSEPDHTSRTKRHTEDRRTRMLGWMHESECFTPPPPLPPPPPHRCYPCTATLLIMSPEGCLSRITKFWFLVPPSTPPPAQVQTWLNKNWKKLFPSHFGSWRKS